jgi:hypothetical protein
MSLTPEFCQRINNSLVAFPALSLTPLVEQEQTVTVTELMCPEQLREHRLVWHPQHHSLQFGFSIAPDRVPSLALLQVLTGPLTTTPLRPRS